MVVGKRFSRLVGCHFLLAVGVLSGGVGSAHAQEFVPPGLPPQDSTVEREDGRSVGIVTFGARLGWDFRGSGEPLVGINLDVISLSADRLRLRSLVEIGFSRPSNTYVIGGEVLYRHVDARIGVVPFVGVGVALAGRDQCRTVAGCPTVWLQASMGVEGGFGEHMNWLVEFRGEDRLRRHRLFVGFVTKGGG